MVEIARIISPSEAMTLAAMLEAAGLLCQVGGWRHHSIEINALALGGFRLAVPHAQYEDASALIREYRSQPIATAPFFAQRRRVLRMMAVAAPVMLLPLLLATVASEEALPPWTWIAAPLVLAGLPVPPQGSGDYFLARAEPA